MTRPNAEHLTPAREIADCLVCRTPHLAGMLVQVKAPCDCYVAMCDGCQRAAMTVEWLKYYACACRRCRHDVTLQLSA